MQPSQSIARMATRLSWFTRISIGLFVTAGAVVVWYPGYMAQAVPAQLEGVEWADLAGWQKALTHIFGSVAPLLLLYGLWQVRAFFELYRSGDLFPSGAGFYIKRFGQALVGIAVAQIVAGAAISAVLTAHLPDGQGMLAVNLSSTNLATLVIAALIMMMGRLLDEASTIAEENRSIV
ncbi:MAG: DUF2975 domain-containing protein [Anderseniella sp.]|nr:DUF2975 domain-containing protein [Anderseniella sp.]